MPIFKRKIKEEGRNTHSSTHVSRQILFLDELMNAVSSDLVEQRMTRICPRLDYLKTISRDNIVEKLKCCLPSKKRSESMDFRRWRYRWQRSGSSTSERGE